MDDSSLTGSPLEPAAAARVQQMLADAVRHFQSGELDDAQSLCRNIIDAEPENAAALTMLGAAAWRMGQLAEGTTWFRRAVAAKPNSAEGHFNLANVLQAQNL